MLGPGARWLLDAVDPDEVTEIDEGTRVVLRTDAPRWLARLMLMGGGQARVDTPAWLARQVAEMARETRAVYEPMTSG